MVAQIYGASNLARSDAPGPAMQAVKRIAAEAELAEDTVQLNDFFCTLHEHTHIAMANMLCIEDAPNPGGRAEKALLLVDRAIDSLEKRGQFFISEQRHDSDAALAMR